MEVTVRPIALSNSPQEEAMTPLPMPDMTPPVTRIYFMIKIRQEIKAVIQKESVGPLMVRLAWHSSGTYNGRSGGSDGATMRYAPESTDPANAGLEQARALLEPIYQKFQISYADLYTLAGGC